MFRIPEYGLTAGDRRTWIKYVGWRIRTAAGFAAVAILVFRTTLGARAADKAVGQEHSFLFVIQLFDITAYDVTTFIESLINLFDLLPVILAVG